jgi:hypothetical protein
VALYLCRKKRSDIHSEQGDKNGRIFADWVIVYFGQFCENYRNSPKIWANFFHGKSYVFVLTENVLGVFSQTHLVALILKVGKPEKNQNFCFFLQCRRNGVFVMMSLKEKKTTLTLKRKAVVQGDQMSW